ncbi:hypothetical protein RI138_26730 [Streptomyces sp. C11-1]|uniref:Secreted protein n=1 Tax=Streptomyces durocortorensis TaxID=2811104 RepID=A0ABY9W9X3_9ACTN|nr:hypothetical protein [Streptomyces durocortorensis]WNF30136.1 hypothetical protein RI138_26730 [Streptomyces durocortorensis]
MNTGLKITAFAAALAATFGTAYAVGSALDPAIAEKGQSPHGEAHGVKEYPKGEGVQEEKREAAELPGGLRISEGGFALDLRTPRVEAGKEAELRFAVVDEATSRNVTAFRREHGKELRLVVASNDLTTYRRLHPVRAADGTWFAPVELPEAGGYRVFADFTPDVKKAESLTLGADLSVAGDARPEPLPRAEKAVTVDEYEVTLDGVLRPGAGSELKLNVEKGGKPVTDLQPHLGAYGHLVALRSGDLAHLHLLPNGGPGDGRTKPGPEISFTATAPSKGAYRLFLDFQHEGEVRTAAFTVHAGEAAAGNPAPEGGESAPHEH